MVYDVPSNIVKEKIKRRIIQQSPQKLRPVKGYYWRGIKK